MPGLFIQRQAESLTSYCDVAVLFIHAEKNCPNKLEVEFAEENKVRVMRIYYQIPSGNFALLNRLASFYRFYRTQSRALKSIRDFHPDLVHAHVLTRMGLIAMRLGAKRNIPYVISEHWSRYFPGNPKFTGFFKKLLTRIIVKKAAAILVVSEKLKQAMLDHGLKNENYRIVPNIIDPGQFRLLPLTHEDVVKTMIHISCFEDRSKNISGFLRAVKALSAERRDFRVMMVGEGPDLEEMKEYAGFLRMNEPMLTFTGLKTGDALVELINRADFMVLSSHFETFGSVVVESLSCGTPVVATPVGVVPEIIHADNGMIAPTSGEDDLKQTLDKMLDKCRTYDRQQIREGIKGNYSAETVGREILTIYQNIINQYK